MPKGTGKRFEAIAEELFKGNVSELARNLQMTPGAFTKYVKGDTMPGGKILLRLISLDINPAWVLAGIPPMKISHIQEAGIVSFTNSDIEEYGEKGIDEIAKSAPKELKLSQLNPEVYNSPVKMMSYVIKDFELAWQKEGIHLPESQKKEVLHKMMDIIIQQATNAKNRLEQS